MKKNLHKRITTVLSIIWIVSAAIAYLLSGVSYVQQHNSEEIPPETMTIHKLSPFIFVFCYLFPLLFLVKKHASLACMEKVVIASKILIAVFSLMLLIMLIALISML